MPSGMDIKLTGRVTRLKAQETKSGKDMLSFSLPCEYGRKNDEGKRPCVWFRIVAMEHSARALEGQLQDGDHVVVWVDSISAKTYEDKNGKPAVSLEAWVQDWQVAKLCWVKKGETKPTPETIMDAEGSDGDGDADIPF